MTLPAPLLRVEADLVETVGQLVWVAAPEAEVMRDEVDEAGLVPLYVRPGLTPAQAAAFERGLEALLDEVDQKARGTYLREVSDVRGRRRELGVPVAPGAWAGRPGMVGPFQDEAQARAWQASSLPAGWLSDTIPHAGAWYVDVFVGDEALNTSGSR